MSLINCSDISLPTLPTGYVYACSTSTNYKKTDGTGWIPINFNSLDTGSPIAVLATDPTNSTTTGLFYTYTSGTSSYELNATFESQVFRLSGDSDRASTDGGDNYSLYEIGTDLTLNPLKDSGLVGYWRMDGGTSGSIANNQTLGLEDTSGSANNGTAKNANGTGMAWIPGKAGGAVSFDGTDDYVNVGSGVSLQPDIFTVTAWFKTSSSIHQTLLSFASNGYRPELDITYGEGKSLIYLGNSNFKYFNHTPVNPDDGNWHLASFVVVGNGQNDIDNDLLYIDSQLLTASTVVKTGLPSPKIGPVTINLNAYPYSGSIDDVRIYNRALSAAEILAIYNASR